MKPLSLNEWIIHGEVGRSSKSMWAAIKGVAKDKGKGSDFDVPYDSDDFKRCLLFYRQCNLSSWHLEKIKRVFPWWRPFIDNWDKLVYLWEEESPTGRCPQLYKFIQELEEESKIADGWIQTSPTSWRKTRAT